MSFFLIPSDIKSQYIPTLWISFKPCAAGGCPLSPAQKMISLPDSCRREWFDMEEIATQQTTAAKGSKATKPVKTVLWRPKVSGVPQTHQWLPISSQFYILELVISRVWAIPERPSVLFSCFFSISLPFHDFNYFLNHDFLSHNFSDQTASFQLFFPILT